MAIKRKFFKKLGLSLKGSYKGMSLVETLITIVIISTVMLLASITLTTLIKASVVSSAKTASREESEFILEYVRRTLRNSHNLDVKVYAPSGRTYNPENGQTQDEEGLQGYSVPLSEGVVASEIHFRPAGSTRWVCLGFFKEAGEEDSENGYLLKSSAASLSNASSCFDSSSSEYRMHTVQLNSSEINVTSFDLIYFETQGDNVLMTVDIEVEPVNWTEGFTGSVTPKFFKQAVISTQKLSWE